MPIKDDRVEFRCPAAMKRRLLECRPLIGARTLSQTARTLLERLIENPDANSPWASVPALMDLARHLDRIASALQRCLLDGSAPTDCLKDLPGLMAQIRELLDGGTIQRSGTSRPLRRGRC